MDIDENAIMTIVSDDDNDDDGDDAEVDDVGGAVRSGEDNELLLQQATLEVSQKSQENQQQSSLDTIQEMITVHDFETTPEDGDEEGVTIDEEQSMDDLIVEEVEKEVEEIQDENKEMTSSSPNASSGMYLEVMGDADDDVVEVYDDDEEECAGVLGQSADTLTIVEQNEDTEVDDNADEVLIEGEEEEDFVEVSMPTKTALLVEEEEEMRSLSARKSSSKTKRRPNSCSKEVIPKTVLTKGTSYEDSGEGGMVASTSQSSSRAGSESSKPDKMGKVATSKRSIQPQSPQCQASSEKRQLEQHHVNAVRQTLKQAALTKKNDNLDTNETNSYNSTEEFMLLSMELLHKKRKRYPIMHSDADEDLLGFDDITGNAINNKMSFNPVELMANTLSKSKGSMTTNVTPAIKNKIKRKEFENKENDDENTIINLDTDDGADDEPSQMSTVTKTKRQSNSETRKVEAKLFGDGKIVADEKNNLNLSEKTSLHKVKETTMKKQQQANADVYCPPAKRFNTRGTLPITSTPLIENKNPKKGPLNKKSISNSGNASVDDGKELKVSKIPTTSSSRMSTNSNQNKALSAQDLFYRKPFDYGWKRELVWRSNQERGKEKADVYFISPYGKKLRSRSEIAPYLEGDLTIDHFCFAREMLGAGIDCETQRSANKQPSRAATSSISSPAAAAATEVPINIGKRISKPKVPKGASPPPEGWTAAQALKVNNAALMSSSHSARYSGADERRGQQQSARKTSHSGGTSSVLQPESSTVGVKLAKSKSRKVLSPPITASSTTEVLPAAIVTMLNAVTTSQPLKTTEVHPPPTYEISGNSTNNVPPPMKSSIATTLTAKEVIPSSSSATVVVPCTMTCPRAPNQVPQLQCVKCSSLYHHECVGISPQSTEYRTVRVNVGKDFICQACPRVDNVSYSAVPSEKNTGREVSMKSRMNFPQSLAVVKGRKYLVVSRTIKTNSFSGPLAVPPKDVIRSSPLPLSPILINDRNTNECPPPNQTTNKCPTAVGSGVRAVQDQTVERRQHLSKQRALHYFSSASFAYDAVLKVFQYLKIHERPKAAAVCKLWNMASKDTMLWNTVRMKNSRVYDWAGFSAALRRGETKHLDLRKMLLSNSGVRSSGGGGGSANAGSSGGAGTGVSGNGGPTASTGSGSGSGDDFWQEFSDNICTVTSLKTIDLCRCSRRVVERLFRTNLNLRVLNAVAINDTNLNLTGIYHLKNLVELRLRCTELCTLNGCEEGTRTVDNDPYEVREEKILKKSDLQSLSMLTNLRHLSLTSVKYWGTNNIEHLSKLQQLITLELGECGTFKKILPLNVLKKLHNLQRLRLENGQLGDCCTLTILDVIHTDLHKLQQLELINFDVPLGFEEKLKLCTNILKLLIIPTYISQSATTNHLVLSAVQKVSGTLKSFTWGVTVELLRVTALYVDQCKEAIKAERSQFVECIPVLKPVPGAQNIKDMSYDEEDSNGDKKSKQKESGAKNNNHVAAQQRAHEPPIDEDGDVMMEDMMNIDPEGQGDGEEANQDVPQIEILPLHRVESILAENLPYTKFTIVKVPYYMTCKQQLVE